MSLQEYNVQVLLSSEVSHMTQRTFQVHASPPVHTETG